MSTHAHSKAECDGVAIIRYRRVDGEEKEWPIGASTCPLRPDTEDSIRAHFERHRPGCTWVGVRILTMAQWDKEGW
jgi:hypothetical protein